MEVSKVRRVLLELLGINARPVGAVLSYWNCSSTSKCTMNINRCRLSDRVLKYTLTVKVVSRRIRGAISYERHMPNITTESLSACQSPVDMWGPFKAYHEIVSISAHKDPPIKNEIYQARQHVSNHQQSYGAQVKCKVLCHEEYNSTRVGLRLRKPPSTTATALKH